MKPLPGAMIGEQHNELKQRFFSTPLPHSAAMWEQLAASEILDCIPAGVAFLDKDLILRYKNKTYAAYLDDFTAGTSSKLKAAAFSTSCQGAEIGPKAH